MQKTAGSERPMLRCAPASSAGPPGTVATGERRHSDILLREAAKELTQRQIALVQPRITYIGGSLPIQHMAELFQLSDAYLTPYSAEAFNLPALEAVACGLPVICTAGGPTDEFVPNACALRVAAKLVQSLGDGGDALVPDAESLIARMWQVRSDEMFRLAAKQAGPGHAQSHFTWKLTVDKLIREMKPHQV
ncbi:MAG TPA: glycosyltransferase [Tepidisphaeraceae bacterium]|nr:glycosyltransferase [Tepidisphaeraceae bacterium]